MLSFADTYNELAFTYGEEILEMLDPWMLQHPDLAAAYLEEILDAGGTGNPQSAILALETIRLAPEYREMYDAAFPGNRREDGTLRLKEGAYNARIQGYRDAVMSVTDQLDPHLFDEEYPELIMGDVDINEFQRRVDALYTRVINGGDGIRDYYGTNFGIDVTEGGILASLMSRRVHDAVLTRMMTMAEIGGEASIRSYDLSKEFVGMLADEGGMDRDEAQRLFGTAESILPALNALARRHGDTDDTFDITEFAMGASGIADPEQVQRLGRLQSQESSLFTGGAELEWERNRATGGISGLQQT